LAEDGLVNQDDASRFFVPAPTERDVLETYTARGLLGTAIVRRLALRAQLLPEVVDEVFKELVWYAGQHDIAATGSLRTNGFGESNLRRCPRRFLEKSAASSCGRSRLSDAPRANAPRTSSSKKNCDAT